MRRILFSLVLGLSVVGFLAGAAMPRSASAAASTAATTTIESARHAPSSSLAPDSIFGKWWKKLKKIIEGFLNFIDGVIDTIGGGGDRRGFGMIVPGTDESLSPALVTLPGRAGGA